MHANILCAVLAACQQAHPLACSSFLAPSPITLKILHQLVISCEKVGCTKTINFTWKVCKHTWLVIVHSTVSSGMQLL